MAILTDKNGYFRNLTPHNVILVENRYDTFCAVRVTEPFVHNGTAWVYIEAPASIVVQAIEADKNQTWVDFKTEEWEKNQEIRRQAIERLERRNVQDAPYPQDAR